MIDGDMLRLVSFKASRFDFGVDLACVERVIPLLEIRKLPDAPSAVLGVINLHGSIVPVFDLCAKLGTRPNPVDVTTKLLVIRTPRFRRAIVADEVYGVVQFQNDQITLSEKIGTSARYLKGVASAHGGLIHIFDLELFLTSDEDLQLDRAMAGFVSC